MDNKKLIKFVGGLAIVFLGIFIIVSLFSNLGGNDNNPSKKELETYNSKPFSEKMDYLTKNIKV